MDDNFTSPFKKKRTVFFKLLESVLYSRSLCLLGRKTGTLAIVALMLLFVACAKGYDDGWTFSSGEEGATLESPKAENVTFTPSADGATIKIEWPVVYGAGGYQFSFYIVDDPDNPVAVGEENQFIDGCSASRELLEETEYKVVIRTLANEAKNNKEATAATEKEYSTWAESIEVPGGADLTAYFAANEPISGVNYALEAGGSYTISGDIDFGTKDIVLRGDKITKPTVTVAGRLLTQGGGIKLRFVDLDLSGLSSEFINYGDPSSDMPIQGSDSYSVTSPVVLEACEISGMTRYFIYSASSLEFFIPSLVIKNCVIEIAQMSTSNLFIRLSGTAFVKDFTISNSTIYNHKGGADSWYFVQYGNGSLAKADCNEANLVLTNNTFYNICYSQNMANYNMMRQSAYKITIKKNIFDDCGNQNVVHRLAAGNANPVRDCDQNAYWYNGAFPELEITSSCGDKSGTHFAVAPAFTNPANGDFTIGASELITARVGDPRWLPVQ